MILRRFTARTDVDGLDALTRNVDLNLLPELRDVAGFCGILLAARTGTDGAGRSRD